jgi:hypothetical protein
MDVQNPADLIVLAFREGLFGKAKDLVEAADTPDFRQEMRNRLDALEILENGTKSIEELLKHLQTVLAKEQKLCELKREKVQSKERNNWWDMSQSGWASGGRETLGDLMAAILHSLGETKLSQQVQDRIGFTRTLPLPEPEPEPEVKDKPGEKIGEPAPPSQPASKGSKGEGKGKQKRERKGKGAEATAAAFNPQGLPYARAVGPEWLCGAHSFQVESSLTLPLSRFLREQSIDHVFIGGAHGKARICFRSEADKHSANSAISALR